MNVFTMVVIIVAICVFGDVLKRIFDVKKVKSQQPQSDEFDKLININEQLNQQVKVLESRVSNLETIVTQEGYDLKQTINSL